MSLIGICEFKGLHFHNRRQSISTPTIMSGYQPAGLGELRCQKSLETESSVKYNKENKRAEQTFAMNLLGMLNMLYGSDWLEILQRN